LLANSSVGNASKKDASSNLKIAPNPVSSSAIFSFSLPAAGKVSLKIFDMNGRLINAVAEKVFAAGEHQLKWDATNVRAGIYILKMQAGNYAETKKVIVVR